MNKVILSGNLTRDPELKTASSGKAYARAGIAVNRPFSKDKTVDFFNLLIWDKSAEAMNKYLAKGSRILVEGRLQTSKYKDKDGKERTATEIVVENWEFADSKKKAADDFDGEPVDDTPF